MDHDDHVEDELARIALVRPEIEKAEALRMDAHLKVGEHEIVPVVGQLIVQKIRIIEPQPRGAFAFGLLDRRTDILHPPPEVLRIKAHLARSEEHTSELQSLMRISYAVFCLKKNKKTKPITKQKSSTQQQNII